MGRGVEGGSTKTSRGVKSCEKNSCRDFSIGKIISRNLYVPALFLQLSATLLIEILNCSEKC
jgi:hypothetical protein